MDTDLASLRPVLSGVVGGILAAIFCKLLARWVPQICNGKRADTLIRENRVAILVANLTFLSGLLVGIGIYKVGIMPSSDWRGLALGVGGGCMLGLVVLPLQSLAAKRSPKEAYVAYAISQGAPVLLVYGILVFCMAAFTMAIVSLL